MANLLEDIHLIAEIEQLKQEREAVILAHVYQPPEIQEIADYTGDSFALSRQAAATKAKVIVFCGVHFMAETANILAPDKITLLPAKDAGCLMFDDRLEDQLRQKIAQHPEAVVISYVNTPAGVKALSDICCTSSNAVRVVEAVPADRDIIFVPDRNLASYAEEKTGRNIYCWPGACPWCRAGALPSGFATVFAAGFAAGLAAALLAGLVVGFAAGLAAGALVGALAGALLAGFAAGLSAAFFAAGLLAVFLAALAAGAASRLSSALLAASCTLPTP